METRTDTDSKEAKEHHSPPTPIRSHSLNNSLSFTFRQTHEQAVIELEELKEYSESPPEGERRNSNFRITIRGASQTSFDESLPEMAPPEDESYLHMAYKFVKEGIFSFYDLHLDDSCYSSFQLKAGRFLQTTFSLYSAWIAYQRTDDELTYLKWPDTVITPLSAVAAIATFVAIQKGIGKGIQRINTFEDRVDSLERRDKLNRNRVFAVAKTMQCSRDFQQLNQYSAQLLIQMKKGETILLADHEHEEQSSRGCFKNR